MLPDLAPRNGTLKMLMNSTEKKVLDNLGSEKGKGVSRISTTVDGPSLVSTHAQRGILDSYASYAFFSE